MGIEASLTAATCLGGDMHDRYNRWGEDLIHSHVYESPDDAEYAGLEDVLEVEVQSVVNAIGARSIALGLGKSDILIPAYG